MQLCPGPCSYVLLPIGISKGTSGRPRFLTTSRMRDMSPRYSLILFQRLYESFFNSHDGHTDRRFLYPDTIILSLKKMTRTPLHGPGPNTALLPADARWVWQTSKLVETRARKKSCHAPKCSANPTGMSTQSSHSRCSARASLTKRICTAPSTFLHNRGAFDGGSHCFGFPPRWCGEP